ncbi:hypothetical protein TNCV_3598421 [Trichonephila clavipes]|nr:hypothetical protein TNCV_3598421 [Trichonephila clavipes]
MTVFSAASGKKPSRSCTAFHITVLSPLIPYYASSHIDLDLHEQQYCDTINRNPSTLQFDLYQSQKLADTHIAFYTIHHNFRLGKNLQMKFVYEKPAVQFFHLRYPNTFGTVIL